MLDKPQTVDDVFNECKAIEDQLYSILTLVRSVEGEQDNLLSNEYLRVARKEFRDALNAVANASDAMLMLPLVIAKKSNEPEA